MYYKTEGLVRERLSEERNGNQNWERVTFGYMDIFSGCFNI